MKQMEKANDLLKITKALNRTTVIEKGFRLVGRYMSKELGLKTLYYDLYSDEKNAVVNVLHRRDEEIKTVPLPVRISLEEYRKPLFLKGEEINTYYSDSLKLFGFKEVISVPIIMKGRLDHLLLFYSTKEGEITGEIQEFAREVAFELGAFIRRVGKSNYRLESFLERLNYLEDLFAQQANNKQEMKAILQRMVESIPKVIEMKKCTIAILDETGEYLLPSFSSFDMDKDNKKYSTDPGKVRDHTAIIAMKTKKPLIIRDALMDPRCDPDLAKELGVYSNVTVPLMDFHGKALGVMYMDNGRYEVFSGEQISLLTIIGRHLGMILSSYHYVDQLQTENQQDGLTGLYNKVSFLKTLESYHHKERKPDEVYSILMMDIDDFKKLNDTFGHVVGDEVLIRMSEILRTYLRENDVIARYGGEEFIILLKKTNGKGAEILAERLRQEIEDLAVHGTGITVSIGISSCMGEDRSPRELIEQADKNLYKGKRQGKNQVVVGNWW